jgi:ABC-type Fe3+ transport system substrate-binding protein
MMERILTEGRAGKPLWDVVMTTTFYGYNMKKRGLFAAYDSPERKFFRDGYKDPQANWTSLYTNYAAFGYNTRMVAKTSVPKSLVDLLRPEWKGNVGLDSRPYEWFGTTVKAMGEEKGWLSCANWPSKRRCAMAEPSCRNWWRRRIQRRVDCLLQTFEALKLAGAPVGGFT